MRYLPIIALISIGCNQAAPSRGYCAKACNATADCCPSVDAGCPGAYPANFVCERGLCRAPVCQSDADCQRTVGATAGCRAVGGHVGCVFLCASDGDCMLGTGISLGTCSATTDDGARRCGGGLPRCTSDADCLGKFHCTDGRCGCLSDADCPSGRHCQDHACGCASDAECGPGLDRCTTDRAFAYPPSPAPAPGH
jgi:hypothetical protein